MKGSIFCKHFCTYTHSVLPLVTVPTNSVLAVGTIPTNSVLPIGTVPTNSVLAAVGTVPMNSHFQIIPHEFTRRRKTDGAALKLLHHYSF